MNSFNDPGNERLAVAAGNPLPISLTTWAGPAECNLSRVAGRRNDVLADPSGIWLNILMWKPH